MLGALSLLAGARTNKTLIRQGTDAVEVEAALYFAEPERIDLHLEALGLPRCEEGALLLQRSIHRSKMPRVQINGSMATLTQLQAMGEAWVDFHGPGEPQKLFKERRQLEMLDLYAGNESALSQYSLAYANWRTALNEIEALESGDRLNDDEIDFVQKQLQQIDLVEPSVESIEALERDYSRMSQAQELLALTASCADGIAGDRGLNEQLNALLSRFETLAELDASCDSLLLRLRSLAIELQDVGDEVGRLSGDFDFEPEAIEAATERMNLWQQLRRKYGGSIESVLQRRQELAQKLSLQGNIEGVLTQRRAAADKLRAGLQRQAKKLTQARRKSALVLAEKAGALLHALGFKKARLEIEICIEPELRDCGDSHCRFLFAPNAGQDLLPLNKIASSGETARVMLALKAVLAESDATPLLIFDEVDANVGGEVGRAVGAELARLSGQHQVLCVTHLPQVASLARNHFVVTKSQDEDSTIVAIAPIHDARPARLQELARMLGDRQSSSALAHAAELMGQA